MVKGEGPSGTPQNAFDNQRG